MTLASTGTAAPVIDVEAGTGSVTVRNGTVEGGRHGVRSGNRFSTIIDGLTVTDSDDTGIECTPGASSQSIVVRNCRVLDVGLRGINIESGTTEVETTVTIENNYFKNLQGHGIRIEWRGTGRIQIRDNTVSDFSLLCGGSQINNGLTEAISVAYQSTATRNGAPVRIADNYVSGGCPGYGRGIIVLSAQAVRIEHNTVVAADNGINAFQSNQVRITGNQVQKCFGVGIHVRTGAGGGPTRNTLVARNSVSGSGSWGLAIDGAGVAKPENTVISRNDLSDNGGTGCAGTAVGTDYCDDGVRTQSTGDNTAASVPTLF